MSSLDRALACHVVSAVAVELARGRVEGDRHAFTAGEVAGLVDRLDDQTEHLFGCVDLRGEAALVSEPGREALARQQLAQRRVDLGTGPHRFGHGRGADRGDHELLEVQLVGAWTPPLRTLKCGTGSLGVTPMGLRERHNGTPAEAAIARAAAIDTPTMALAPSRALFSVPSSLMSAPSISARSAKVRPLIAWAISPLTAPTAPRTPLPPKRAMSPSRSSTASREPVDAPDGTPAAR